MGGAGQDRAAGRQRGGRAARGGRRGAAVPASTLGIASSRVLTFTHIGSERVAYTDAGGLTHIVPLEIAGALAESSAAELPDPHLPRSAADSDTPSSKPVAAER